ncbi:hypothetical protein C1N55_16075 [Lysinibacillus sp. SGAir0095]|nr:hypothetical protein C1N55_16075 [Lysinibacillus sp. SGAir0095]
MTFERKKFEKPHNRSAVSVYPKKFLIVLKKVFRVLVLFFSFLHCYNCIFPLLLIVVTTDES